MITPDADYNDPASFTRTISDATVHRYRHREPDGDAAAADGVTFESSTL